MSAAFGRTIARGRSTGPGGWRAKAVLGAVVAAGGLMFASPALAISAYVLSPFAGTGSGSSPVQAGPATSSGLDDPYGAAVDAQGNVYIADLDHYDVEKVTLGGTLSVIAGDGASTGGYVAGPGAALSTTLDSPVGVAVGGDGTVYVADYDATQVYTITPAGVLTIFANGLDGWHTPQAGPAFNSPLGYVYSVAVDHAGDVYIADYYNKVVEKVTPAGILSVFAGGGTSGPTPGPATSSQLYGPTGVAVDAEGNVYIADTAHSEIDKVTPSGTLSIIAGGGTNGPTPGPATNSQLSAPGGVSLDAAGNLYIADTGHNEIDEVTPSGTLSIIAGNGSSGPPSYGIAATGSPLHSPEDVASSPAGRLYVVDSGNNTVDLLAPAPPDATVVPVITGTASIGQALSADEGSWTNDPVTYAYQWQNCDSSGTTCVDITGATSSTYTVTAADVGHAIHVVVAASNAGGSTTSASAASALVRAPATTPTTATTPTITGTATQGQTLTAAPGTWSDAAAVLAYQWDDCDSQANNCVAISAATSSSYTLTASDVGHTIVVLVTATNAVGSSSAASAATATVQAPPTPTPTPSPTATPSPTPAPATVAVSVGAVPSAGIIVSDKGEAMLTLVCPATPTGCDASGELVIHLPKTLLENSASLFDTDVASADGTTVLASFSGEQIAGGHSAVIAVSLNASVLRRLQTMRIRRVKVTLTVSNHLNGGPAVTSTDTIYLQIPPLSAGACPVATGQLTATTLGPVTLGATRASARRLMPGYTARNYHTDNFCLYAASGIRVGYASAKLLGAAASAAHPATTGTVILALTANPYYTIHGIRPGTALRAAKLKLKAGIRVGHNDWYIIPGTTNNTVLKVRHGIINEIGIATKSLTSNRTQQQQLLSNF